MIKRTIYLILTIICMITIFMFSSEDGEKSQSTSDKAFADVIVDKTISIFPNSNRDNVMDIVSFIVRKSAHFTLFAILGFVLFGFINTYSLELRKKIIITIIIGMLYAISDEIHQLFVPERAGQIRDVFIDTLGVSFGTMVGCLIYRKRGEKIGRARHKTNSSSNLE